MKKEAFPILLPTRNKAISEMGILPMKGLTMSKTWIKEFGYDPQHLYICTNEEIKEGEYMYDPVNKCVERCNEVNYIEKYGWLKIIATTDSSLSRLCSQCREFGSCQRKEGPCVNTSPIPASIPQSFIQKYIEQYNKGEKIEKVMVEYETKLTSQNGQLSITTDFKEKIPTGLGRELNKHSFSGEYTPKLNGNEIIIYEEEKKLYTLDEVEELIVNFTSHTREDVRNYILTNELPKTSL